MKKILAFGAFALLLTACSDDDGPSINYNNLYKKWYNVGFKVNGNTIPYDDHEVCGKDYIEFSESTVSFVDVYGCDGGVQAGSDVLPYTRNGRNITADGETVKIKKLTSTALEIEVIGDYDEDGDDDTIVNVYTSILEE